MIVRARCTLYFTRPYERAIRKLLSEDARREMEGGDRRRSRCSTGRPGERAGIRKLRWADSGRGKRGGIRAIYFWCAAPGAVYMLTAYAKADRDDLTAADKKALARLVAEIEQERQSE